MTYGYIRVSSKDQNEDRQITALKEFGVSPAYMVIEKQSGKDFERPLYKQLIQKLRPGDALIVKSIDRLGRNYNEILEEWRAITKEKNVDIVVLDMPLLDTRKRNDLTGTLIADIVLQLLSYVAQTERKFIKQRQREGIAEAKKKGVKFGRQRKSLTEEQAETLRLWFAGAINIDFAAECIGVSKSTLYRWAERAKKEKEAG